MDAKREYSFLVRSIREEGAQVRTFDFLWGLMPLDFMPGQFSVVKLHHNPKLRGSLTYSSSPGSPEFSFTVKRTGSFGSFFFDQAQVGDLVSLTPPGGPFALKPHHLDLPLCYLARDYCLPALRSMVLWLKSQPQRPSLTLLHEISTTQDALFAKELDQLQKEGFLEVRYCRGSLRAEDLKPLSGHRFFSQAEGLDAKRFRQLLEQIGVDKERSHIERWS